MLGSLLQAVRQDRHPLIHCITNYVTINDCANILLAAGASPIMADAVEEAAAVTARSQGLTLNLGTLHAERIPAMLASGRQANASGIPAVLDPVGAGGVRLPGRGCPAAAGSSAVCRHPGQPVPRYGPWPTPAATPAGWDAGDSLTPQTLDACLELAGQLSRRTGAVVAVTGETDLVTDGETAYCIHKL